MAFFQCVNERKPEMDAVQGKLVSFLIYNRTFQSIECVLAYRMLYQAHPLNDTFS